eukprot:9978226-Alexandrium_andersonii.AAC.1
MTWCPCAAHLGPIGVAARAVLPCVLGSVSPLASPPSAMPCCSPPSPSTKSPEWISAADEVRLAGARSARACVRACARSRARACVCVCVCVRVRARVR